MERNDKTRIRYNFKKSIKIANAYKEKKELKIIGITGSSGKTTTAYILHKYLKNKGYKSILYCSASIDSPLTNFKKNEPCEVPVRNEETLTRIIKEAELYNADYLILEINESVLGKDFLKNLKFKIKVLTNLNPKHNLEQYSEKEYIELKKSFFKNVNEDCKCVIGIQDYDKELLEEILGLNNCAKYLFSTEYIANVKDVALKRIATLLYNLRSSLEGLELFILSNGKNYNFKTNLIMKHNSLNLICVITILEALEIFDEKEFQKTILNIEIPGRVETYKHNKRLFIIDLHLCKTLEYLYELKQEGKINNIRVVVGSIGSGFKNWDKKFLSEKFLSTHVKNKKFAMDVLSKYADYVYLTECDNASETVKEICLELVDYLDGNIEYAIIENRETAIKKAYLESEENDVIFISGRGNRKIMCNSATTTRLIKDSDIVRNLISLEKGKYDNEE